MIADQNPPREKFTFACQLCGAENSCVSRYEADVKCTACGQSHGWKEEFDINLSPGQLAKLRELL